MNKSHSAKPGPVKKDFRNLANVISANKKSSNNNLKIALFIIVALFGLYYVPVLVIIAAVFIIKNKKANQAFKDFLKNSRIDTNSIVSNIAQKMAEHVPPEHRDELKKKLAEYNITPPDHNKPGNQ